VLHLLMGQDSDATQDLAARGQ